MNAVLVAEPIQWGCLIYLHDTDDPSTLDFEWLVEASSPPSLDEVQIRLRAAFAGEPIDVTSLAAVKSVRRRLADSIRALSHG